MVNFEASHWLRALNVFSPTRLGEDCQIWGTLSYMGGVCQIWAPIYYGTVKVNVANLGVCHKGLSYMGSIPDLTNPTHI